MLIKKIYYYIFYKLYKHFENSSQPWWSDWKAGLSLSALEIWFLGSILIYYSIINNIRLTLSITSPTILIPLISIFILNYFSFIHTDIWKEYNKGFDQLPTEKNRRGTIIVWAIVIFIIINFFGSAYYLQKNIFKMY